MFETEKRRYEWKQWTCADDGSICVATGSHSGCCRTTKSRQYMFYECGIAVPEPHRHLGRILCARSVQGEFCFSAFFLNARAWERKRWHTLWLHINLYLGWFEAPQQNQFAQIRHQRRTDRTIGAGAESFVDMQKWIGLQYEFQGCSWSVWIAVS